MADVGRKPEMFVMMISAHIMRRDKDRGSGFRRGRAGGIGINHPGVTIARPDGGTNVGAHHAPRQRSGIRVFVGDGREESGQSSRCDHSPSRWGHHFGARLMPRQRMEVRADPVRPNRSGETSTNWRISGNLVKSGGSEEHRASRAGDTLYRQLFSSYHLLPTSYFLPPTSL